MFGSDIIDAAIGLFLVYFLFSVLCSALNEWIVGHMRGLRAKTLEVGIGRLLASSSTQQDFFGLPLVRSMAGKDEKKPSYISSGLFVDGLLALVKNKAKAADPGLDQTVLDKASKELESLRALVRDKLQGVPVQPILESLLSGAKDMDDARKKLEAWFNEGMDRATGWYRKHVQICTAVLAVGAATVFNVDTFTIARELMANSKLRAVLVASAEQTVKQPAAADPTSASNAVDRLEERIKELGLPIGWIWRTNVIDVPGNPPMLERTVLRPGEGWAMKIGGLLATAGALSMGAPFWFDLLGKIVNLRAAGKKPETPKDPGKK